MRITNKINKKIEELLKEMTLEEKVSMCHANSKFYSNGIERLGIEELAMMDGPHGVRSETYRHVWDCMFRPEDRCTYLPTGTALAATWNPSLGRVFGETLGSEARYRGKDIILGPGINIIRTPLCGRNFEYFSEDPCLVQKMSPEVVKGIESQDVAACVKHYCLNNQELDRAKVNVEVSKRALNEIYLKGFYSAIIEGGASSVMGAYNRYDNQHLCHNDYLVNNILKGRWGFEGVYLSDWAGAHNTEECIFNGLDLEMGTNKPYNEYYLADAFLKRAKESDEVRGLLDDKVRRILRLMFSIHKMDNNRKKGAFNTEKHQKATYDIAAEGMVLLKNSNNILPINKEKLTKLLVIGPNAMVKHAAGGSSSGVEALYEVSLYEGIQNKFGNLCEVIYANVNEKLTYKPIPTQMFNVIEMNAGVRAFKQTCYYKESDGNIRREIYYTSDANIEDVTADAYDLECSIKIPESGTYKFHIAANADFAFSINNKCCIEALKEFREWGKTDFEYVVDFTHNENVFINIQIKNPDDNLQFEFGWLTPTDLIVNSNEEGFLEKVESADYVVYCGGLDHSFDTEGMDKKNMLLPGEQDFMISKLAKMNPNLIVAITAGSPVSMPWFDKVDAVIWTWYAGMEGGNVLADILLGEICPSGKMPFTIPKKYEDTPVARYGDYQKDNCKYNEDIFVGYRGFDYDEIQPLIPFGHGISYSQFTYSNLEIDTREDGAMISFYVSNTGRVVAMETTQVYIGDLICSVKRPPKELRNFKKVKLKPGETVKIELLITLNDLSFYDEETDAWKFEDGEFAVYVGSSSRDIRLKGIFDMRLKA